MRKHLRYMAKCRLAKEKIKEPNKHLRYNVWRRLTNGYPVDRVTRKRMPKDYCGRKRYHPGNTRNHLFCYAMKEA